MYLILQREAPQGTAVPGKLYIRRSETTDEGVTLQHDDLICYTLEHRSRLFLPLIYRVQVCYSVEQNVLLPMLCGVPGRSGIRIRRGTRPEQSHGAILVPHLEIEDYLTDMLLRAQQEQEEICLEVNNP